MKPLRRWGVLALVAFGAQLASAAAVAQTQPIPTRIPPTVVSKDAPALSFRGDAAMRFFGMKVYDIRLYTQSARHSFEESFALELIYDLGLKGHDIAARSIDEMRKIGYTDEMQLARWLADMKRVFPDIKKGDTLVGLHEPGKPIRFFSRDKYLDAVNDPEFGKAFFGIWLSPKTSEPKLRVRLLGDTEAAIKPRS